MIRKRVTRSAAQTEIVDQADYLAEHAGEATAYRFLAAVDDTVNSLLDRPGIGVLWNSDHPRLHDIRHKPVKGFPNHLVFYRATDDLVEVLHLYHAAQNLEELLETDETP